jgi:hypothetical protein
MGQPDAEHPTQGRPFDGKLEAQPPSQLLTPRSILRSFSSTDSSPAVGDVPRDTVRLTVLRVTARCWGLCDLATGFGAWTVMLGRAVGAELGSVRDIAVPLSNTVDRTARAEGATRLDDILITRSLKSGNFVPGVARPATHMAQVPLRPIDLRTIARSKQLRWLPDVSFRGSAPVSTSDVLVA